METPISTDSGLQTTGKHPKNSSESRGRAERSRHGSKPNSPTEKGVVATKKADQKLSDSEVELSLLQSAFERFLEAGGQARLHQMPQSTILLIELWGVTKCHNCEAWTTLTTCPGCQTTLSM